MQLNISKVYLSITADLLTAAITLAKNYCTIRDEDISIIMPAPKPILYHNDFLWNKNDNPNFGITMGAFDSGSVWTSRHAIMEERIYFW